MIVVICNLSRAKRLSRTYDDDDHISHRWVNFMAVAYKVYNILQPYIVYVGGVTRRNCVYSLSGIEARELEKMVKRLTIFSGIHTHHFSKFKYTKHTRRGSFGDRTKTQIFIYHTMLWHTNTFGYLRVSSARKSSARHIRRHANSRRECVIRYSTSAIHVSQLDQARSAHQGPCSIMLLQYATRMISRD